MDQRKELNPVEWPRLGEWPLPGKALATMIILMMAIGLGISIGQTIVHDIIPTFSGGEEELNTVPGTAEEPDMERGDLFADVIAEEEEKPFYETDEFIFALKFTHIHIFGMSIIFVFMGAIVLFLDFGAKARAWLVILPFVGIIIDLAAVWLKLLVSPAFFWLHIPGFGIIGLVFLSGSVLALLQMWRHSHGHEESRL
jgi:hypothetical protein